MSTNAETLTFVKNDSFVCGILYIYKRQETFNIPVPEIHVKVRYKLCSRKFRKCRVVIDAIRLIYHIHLY